MILLPSLLLPLALLAAPTAPDSGVVTQPVELNGAWKFRTGDDIAWAGDLKADAGWKDIAVPGELETVAPDYDGFAWYRRSVVLPPALRGEPVGIAFGVVGDAFEVYWNGQKIGGRGTFPPDFVEGVDPSLILVPASAIARRPNGPHLVAVRIYNDYAYGGLMGRVRVARYDVLAERRSPGDIVIGGLVSFFLAIGAYHLVFFMRRRAAREHLYFSVLCGLIALYGSTYSSAVQAAIVPHVNPYRLGLVAQLAAAPFFIALVYGLFDLRLRRRELLTFAGIAACVGLAVVLPLHVLSDVNAWIDAGLILGLVALVLKAGIARPAGRPYARTLLVGTAAFSLAIAYDVASQYNVVPLPVASLLPGVSGVFWVGFLVFVVAVGIATAGKWAITEVTAQVDPLTQLSRRHVLEDALDREAERLRRTGGSLALIVIDLDHFKQINDTYGHQTGDVVLARVGRLLRHTVRNIDLPARLGGEEFGILLYDTTLDGAVAFADRFRRYLRDIEFVVAGGTFRVTASVGISVGADVVDREELIVTADRALYRAKDEGRDRVIGTELPAGPTIRIERRSGD